jgi:hypothetical protein
MISQKELDELIHSKEVYDFGGMMAVIEEKFDELQSNDETKINVPGGVDFWHFSLDYVVGEIDNGCIRNVNWEVTLKRNAKKPQWVKDICQIGVDCFGSKDYEVYIGW